MSILKEWEPHALVEIIKECGAKSLEFYHNSNARLKDDLSLVTVADKSIENMLCDYFICPEEDVFMIGEETISHRDEDYLSKAFVKKTWVVDPIDGTAPYAHQIPTWGVSIGYMENGKLLEGAFLLPAFNEVFMTFEGKTFHGVDLPKTWTFDSLTPLVSPQHEANALGLVSLSQKMSKRGVFNASNPVHSICSCVYSTARVATGNYMGYIASVNLWDMAACLPILYNCGCEIRDLSGRRLPADVSNEFYHLQPDDPQRWSARGFLIFSPNQSVADYLIEHSIFDAF